MYSDTVKAQVGSVADLGPGSEGHTENGVYLKLIC